MTCQLRASHPGANGQEPCSLSPVSAFFRARCSRLRAFCSARLASSAASSSSLFPVNPLEFQWDLLPHQVCELFLECCRVITFHGVPVTAQAGASSSPFPEVVIKVLAPVDEMIIE